MPRILSASFLAALVCLHSSCAPSDSGDSCSVIQNANGSSTLSCDDVELTATPSAGGAALDLSHERLGTTLTLPALSQVGSLVVARAGVDTLRFPALTTVDGLLQVNQTQLAHLELPVLAHAGEVLMQANSALSHLSLPALTTVSQEKLDLMFNPALESLELPSLTTAAMGIYISTSPLTALSLPALTTVTDGCLCVASTGLTSLTFPALATAWNVSVGSNKLLTGVSMPSLATIGWELTVSFNEVLSSLGVPALTAANRLWIKENPQLSECVVTELRDRLIANGSLAGGCTSGGNKACP